MSQNVKIRGSEDSEKIVVIDERFILQEYEALYINSDKRSIPSAFFKGLSRKQQNEQALKIIRFAFKYYLNWTPNQIKEGLTTDIIKKLKLDTLINTYIDFPPEYTKSGLDIVYLAYLLYPNKFHLSVEEQCINMLHRIYRGELKKYPSSWIDSNNGIIHLQILIRYVIQQLPRFKNPEALYEFFASPQGLKALKDYKIYNFITGLYASPLQAVHQSLPPNAQSEFLFNAVTFDRDFKKLKK